MAHIITGVIGAGVLSLAWATAELGWIGGPAALIAFAGVTLVSAFLLSDCYLFPDADNGPLRLNSYSQAVKVYLGYTSNSNSNFIHTRKQILFYVVEEV